MCGGVSLKQTVLIAALNWHNVTANGYISLLADTSHDERGSEHKSDNTAQVTDQLHSYRGSGRSRVQCDTGVIYSNRMLWVNETADGGKEASAAQPLRRSSPGASMSVYQTAFWDTDVIARGHTKRLHITKVLLVNLFFDLLSQVE